MVWLWGMNTRTDTDYKRMDKREGLISADKTQGSGAARFTHSAFVPHDRFGQRESFMMHAAHCWREKRNVMQNRTQTWWNQNSASLIIPIIQEIAWAIHLVVCFETNQIRYRAGNWLNMTRRRKIDEEEIKRKQIQDGEAMLHVCILPIINGLL